MVNGGMRLEVKVLMPSTKHTLLPLLLWSCSLDVKEAWMMFLEKACAQLCCPDESDPVMQYQNCEGGSAYCALQWMTGGDLGPWG